MPASYRERMAVREADDRLIELEADAAGWKAASALLSEMWHHHRLPTSFLLLVHSRAIQQRMWMLARTDDQHERAQMLANIYHQLTCELVAEMVAHGVDAHALASAVQRMRAAHRTLASAVSGADLGFS